MNARIGLLVPLVFLALNASAQLPAQKSNANGVTVTVTPGALRADAGSWDFAVVLDTHSQDLSDDLAKTAVLVDDRGKEFRPIGWEGAAPGGHHRKGILKFNPIAPRPGALELRINRTGEGTPRVFRWNLG